MRIGELADRTGVTAKTIRYYEQVGVLRPPERTGGGYRDYGEDVVGRLEFVRSSQAVGLTLAEIRGVLEVRDGGTPPCTHVVELLQRRIDDVSRRIEALREVQQSLALLLVKAETITSEDCAAGPGVCRILG